MKTKLLKEEEFAGEIGSIRQKLNEIRTAGTVERRKGQKIYFELYPAAEPRGWLAISHGFTEGVVKYTELIWYFVSEGWNVAICDHRGHGKSFRQVEPHWLVHVDHFQDYVEDFACFLTHVVGPRRAGLPLAVLGHSMGGAVALHLAERHPELNVGRLVLCSPMLAPATDGRPRAAVEALARAFCLAGQGKKCNFAQKPYDGADDFGQPWCCATSAARHHWYLEFVRGHERYQTSAASYSWLREALSQTRCLMRRRNLERVHIPVLLLQAGQDTMVDNAQEDRLAERLPNVRLVIFPDARHEIYQCSDKEVERFVESILQFLEE